MNIRFQFLTISLLLLSFTASARSRHLYGDDNFDSDFYADYRGAECLQERTPEVSPEVSFSDLPTHAASLVAKTYVWYFYNSISHELGHALVAKFLVDNPIKIVIGDLVLSQELSELTNQLSELVNIGGMIHFTSWMPPLSGFLVLLLYPSHPPTPRQLALVYLAGPLVSLGNTYLAYSLFSFDANLVRNFPEILLRELEMLAFTLAFGCSVSSTLNILPFSTNVDGAAIYGYIFRQNPSSRCMKACSIAENMILMVTIPLAIFLQFR